MIAASPVPNDPLTVHDRVKSLRRELGAYRHHLATALKQRSEDNFDEHLYEAVDMLLREIGFTEPTITGLSAEKSADVLHERLNQATHAGDLPASVFPDLRSTLRVANALPSQLPSRTERVAAFLRALDWQKCHSYGGGHWSTIYREGGPTRGPFKEWLSRPVNEKIIVPVAITVLGAFLQVENQWINKLESFLPHAAAKSAPIPEPKVDPTTVAKAELNRKFEEAKNRAERDRNAPNGPQMSTAEAAKLCLDRAKQYEEDSQIAKQTGHLDYYHRWLSYAHFCSATNVYLTNRSVTPQVVDSVKKAASNLAAAYNAAAQPEIRKDLRTHDSVVLLKFVERIKPEIMPSTYLDLRQNLVPIAKSSEATRK
jgi:hypothetical protein